MKKLLCSIFCLLIFSCGSKSQVLKNENDLKKTDCPIDGACSLKVEQNKTLNIINDRSPTLYPEIVNGENIILTFEYKRHEIPDTADGHYIEQLLLELDPNNLEAILSGNTLQNVKLLFARFCYCKGQTGYYKITNGTLKIEKLNKNRYYISLDFSQDSVPQIIDSIGEIFELKKSP